MKLLPILAALVMTGLVQAPAGAENLINCNQMTAETENIFRSELERIGIKTIRGVQSQEYAVRASTGVQQRNEYKSQYERFVIINGEEMKLEFVDNTDHGFFRKDNYPNGWNKYYIKTQISLIVGKIRNNQRLKVYYGINFASNGSNYDDRRHCAGAIIYSIQRVR